MRVTTIALILLAALGPAAAENVDPAASGAQYVWGENVGWINAEPSGDGGPGMQVDDFELTGWMWGENVGWVSLSCKNTASCATVDYGVGHDGQGALSGYAWSENAGWINFAPTAGGGVTIDPATGRFDGEAWSENAGWISFESSGPNPFELLTAWSCSPPPPAPTGVPTILLDRSGDDFLLSWSGAGGATGIDLVIGNLEDLRASGGDFSLSTSECRTDDDPDNAYRIVNGALSQTDDWFLVRAVNCGGAGGYDSGGAGQAASRDAGIAASGAGCP